MSLAERLDIMTKPSGCKLGVIYCLLPSVDEQKALKRALDDKDAFSAREIVSALRAEGYRVGRTVVQEHRAGTCRCAE